MIQNIALIILNTTVQNPFGADVVIESGPIFTDYITAIGSLATALSFVYTIRLYKKSKQDRTEDMQDRIEEKVDNTFFNLLNMFRGIQDKQGFNKKNFEDRLSEIHEEKASLISQKSIRGQVKCFKENYPGILDEVVKVRNDIIPITVGKYDFEIAKLLKSPDFEEKDPGHIYSKITENDTVFKDDRYKILYRRSKELAELYKTVTDHQVDESHVERISICKSVFKDNEFGQYFRSLHRVIKYVNENVESVKVKKNYIGFLRAMLSEEELLLIYYNAFYTDRGEGLKDELVTTNLFGEEKDLPLDNEEPQHFKKELLVWKNDDIQNMRACKLTVKP